MITNDKKEDIKCRMFSGVDMLLQEIEDYSRRKKNLSIEETMYVSDIIKDCSEVLRNIHNM